MLPGAGVTDMEALARPHPATVWALIRVVVVKSAIAMRSMRWPLWYSPDGPTSTTKRTAAKIAAATMPE